jgi:hypothetical protein
MKNFRKYFIGFSVIIILIGGGIFVWINYLSPEAKQARQMQKQYEAYQKWEERYEQAMREDTYGGKTPEETLQMFIEALKKEDIELASKYFMLDTNENSDYFLQREPRILGQLSDFKQQNKLDQLISYLANAKKSADFTSSDEASYRIYENSQLVSVVVLRLNKDSGVWKISSL